MSQHILILGAGSTIAAATARLFARKGYAITLASRDVARMELLAAELRECGPAVITVVPFDALHLLHPESRETQLSTLPKEVSVVFVAFGLLGESVLEGRAVRDDRMHGDGFPPTSAGSEATGAGSQATGAGSEATGAGSEVTDWDALLTVLSTNFNAAAVVLEYYAGLFERRKSGCILALSSVAGLRGRAGNYVYGSAKAGLTTYLSGLRNRLHASGVRVITVLPGFVNTKMIAHLSPPAVLVASAEQVAVAVFRAVHNQGDVVYVRWFWRWIMLVIRILPEGIFKRTRL